MVHLYLSGVCGAGTRGERGLDRPRLQAYSWRFQRDRHTRGPGVTRTATSPYTSRVLNAHLRGVNVEFELDSKPPVARRRSVDSKQPASRHATARRGTTRRATARTEGHVYRAECVAGQIARVESGAALALGEG